MSQVASFRLITSVQDYTRLEISLQRFYPDSFQMLNIIQLKLQEKYPSELDISLYLYEEDEGHKPMNEPFLVCIQIPNVHSSYGVISWCPVAPSSKAMVAYDLLLDWNRVHFLSSARLSFSPLLKGLLDAHGNTSKHKQGIPGVIYYLERSKALEFTPPSLSSVVIKPLDSSLAPKIVSNWKFAVPHSTSVIGSCLRSLSSVGIFVEGELASSAILTPIGLLNILYTEDAHRRKGYGELTMLALCKVVADIGLTPAVEIEATNDRSIALMKKCGFTYLTDLHRFYFEN